MVVPRLARGIRIEANFSTITTMDPSVAFLIKDRNKQSYSVSVPNKGPYGEIIAGTKFHYQKFGSKNNIWANGPSLSEIIIAVSYELNRSHSNKIIFLFTAIRL